jgi:hypothetical protein
LDNASGRGHEDAPSVARRRMEKTEIPRMDAALSVILPPFGFLCKAKPLLLQIGGSSPMGVAHSAQKATIFPSSGRTSPLVFTRTHDNRMPYAGAGSGGGRSSAISRRMSANKCREMATSAIWKAM